MKRRRRILLNLVRMRANDLNRNKDAFKSLTVVGGNRVNYFIDIKMMLRVAFSAGLSWSLPPGVTSQDSCSVPY
jgi:hypothetical protein